MFAVYVKLRNSLNTHRRKREAVYKHSIATDFFYFSILVEILGYNEDPETRQDAKELEWGYIPFQEMKEKNFASVTSFARVWFLDSDEV